jgi:hypothetical protein
LSRIPCAIGLACNCFDCSLLRRIWQSLNNVFPPSNAHDGHSGHFSYPTFEVSVVSCDYVDFVLHNPIHNAVICVDALVVTLQSLPTLVSSDPQSYSVPSNLLAITSSGTWKEARYFGPSFSSSAITQLFVPYDQ